MKYAQFLIFTFFSFAATFAQEGFVEHSVEYSFVENKGQWPERVLFRSEFQGGKLWVEQQRFLFQIQDFSDLWEAHHGHQHEEDHEHSEALGIKQAFIAVDFIGSNEVSSISKRDESTNYYNFFLGNDQSKWASNVHGYGEARLRDLYDGVDLKLIEEHEQLKYEFHVEPNVDPSIIQLKFNGADKVYIDRKGNLVLKTSLGEIIEEKPVAYQMIKGEKQIVSCDFKLKGNVLTYDLGKYEENEFLVIDPTLVFATYSGSVTDNFGMTATYGHDGTAYSGGTVFGNSYPTPAPAWNTSTNMTSLMASAADTMDGTLYGVTDVFISKYSADGSQMLWTNFIGGGGDTTGTETVHSLICDESDNIYFFGVTSSTDFPIQNGFQTNHAGGTSGVNLMGNATYFKEQGTDIYISKFSSNGLSLLGSTYCGGTANDGVNLANGLWKNYGDPFRGEIMLDNSGDVIIASCTYSTNFPVLNAFQNSNAGNQDGVIFKVAPDMSSLIWSSYFGGTIHDACYSVKVDESNDLLIAGGTRSSGLSMMSGWQSSYGGGISDGYLLKVSSDGSSLIAGTYLGTSNYDQAYFVEVDRDKSVYVVGQSENGAFPVINSVYQDTAASQFVAKLDSTLNFVEHSTVFGSGSSTVNISPSAFMVDICGTIYVSGWGNNINGMQTTSDAEYPTAPNGYDFYLLALEKDFDSLVYATYFGASDAGEHVDGGTSRFDRDGVVYQSVCGACGGSTGGGIGTSGAWSTSDLSNNCNNLVFKLDFELLPKSEFSVDDQEGCKPFTVTFNNSSSGSDSYLWDFGNGDTTSQVFNPVLTFDSVGVFTVNLYVTDSTCLITDTSEISISVYDSLVVSTIPDQDLCEPNEIDFIAYTSNTATEFVWSTNNSFSDTLYSSADSIFTYTPTESVVLYVSASNDGCSKIDSVVVEVLDAWLDIEGDLNGCVDELLTVSAVNSHPSISFSYTWSPDSVISNYISAEEIQVSLDTTQYIFLEALSSNGCFIEDSVLIQISEIPQELISATASDHLVPSGATVDLIGTAPGGLSYQWVPAVNVQSPTALSSSVLMENSTLFYLQVTDGICLRSDTTMVDVYQYVCGDDHFYVPNAFTPNGDGENEVLYVRGEAIYEMLFRIFDRWGELVFETTERGVGWDGTFKDKPLDPDVYDYYLQVTCIDGMESIVKGNVTLIR